ncbi:MAG: DsbA family oxidoreductase [Flavobacteriia bacterium]|jgi:protein disulfide-isomerase
MKIEIWSDIMCPFCYIGKRHLEKAIHKMNIRDALEIEWKSYQLDPTIPVQTKRIGVYEYLSDAKGISLEQSKLMHERALEMAKNAGLTYNFDHAIIGNSFDAHRLIQFAKTKCLGDEMEEELFKAYFTNGKDIASKDDLLEIGKTVGLKENEVKELLNTDSYSEEVKKDLNEAQQIGVRGVPFFVFDRKYALSGAQPVEAFVETIKTALGESTNL